MAKHAHFSPRMQDALRAAHGRQTFRAEVEQTETGSRYVQRPVREVSYTAHVYASEDGATAVVATGIYDPDSPMRWDDVVDLGPVGKHVGRFRADGVVPAPTRPMVVPMERLDALMAGTLTVQEMFAAEDAADELARSLAASPAP